MQQWITIIVICIISTLLRKLWARRDQFRRHSQRLVFGKLVHDTLRVQYNNSTNGAPTPRRLRFITI